MGLRPTVIRLHATLTWPARGAARLIGCNDAVVALTVLHADATGDFAGRVCQGQATNFRRLTRVPRTLRDVLPQARTRRYCSAGSAGFFAIRLAVATQNGTYQHKRGEKSIHCKVPHVRHWPVKR